MDPDEIRTNLKIATGAAKPEGGCSIPAALKRLDAMAQDETLPGDLAHYLSRRSYVKALEWLDHPDRPHQI